MAVVSAETLRAISPRADTTIVKDIAGPLNKWMPAYGITTHLRISHFLAQLAHESAGFKTMHEYASGAAYEGRANLGNTQPGDGRRFKGRGLIQLTGRANYKTFGDRIGVDLIENPERAASPDNAVRLACEYWKDRKLNALADKDDVEGITRKINGGLNGLADRKLYLARAKKLVTGTVTPDAPLPKPPPKKHPVPPKTTGTIGGAATGAVVANALGWQWHEVALAAAAIAVIGFAIGALIHHVRKGGDE